MAIRVEWVTCTAVVTQIERQKARCRALQASGHLHFAVAHGKVHQRTRREAQQRLCPALGLWLAVETILIHGILHRLGEIGFQLAGRDGDAVEEQHQIDGVLAGQRVAHLANHAQAVCRVLGGQLWVHA
ncbi:hypothetical protein D9M70_558350 [compost metagenome]